MNSLFSTTYKRIKMNLGTKPCHVMIDNMSKLIFDSLVGCRETLCGRHDLNSVLSVALEMHDLRLPKTSENSRETT